MNLYDKIYRDFMHGELSKEHAVAKLCERCYGFEEFDAKELVEEWAAEADDRGYTLKENDEQADPNSFEDYEQGQALGEMVTAAPIADKAPEKVRKVITRLPETLEERIAMRKARNAKIKENLEYHEQEWTNDIKKDEPSAYEEWRGEIVEDNKELRKEQDEADFEREAGNKTHAVNKDISWTLNRQEDEFLNWFYNDKEEAEEADDPARDFDDVDLDDFEDIIDE